MVDSQIRFDTQCYFCQNEGVELGWRQLPNNERICKGHADRILDKDGPPPSGRAISYTDI